MVKQYVVEWKDVGYYAQKQPTYEWCFTKDIAKAKPYKSQKLANERGGGTDYGMGHDYRPFRLVEVDGNFVIVTEPGKFKTREEPQKKILEKGPEITLASLLKTKVTSK